MGFQLIVYVTKETATWYLKDNVFSGKNLLSRKKFIPKLWFLKLNWKDYGQECDNCWPYLPSSEKRIYGWINWRF
jgi:hypothetical protein